MRRRRKKLNNCCTIVYGYGCVIQCLSHTTEFEIDVDMGQQIQDTYQNFSILNVIMEGNGS